MSGTDESKGPDLTQGVPASAFAAGAIVVGHVDDESVLAVRVGGIVRAIGAKCPHYGGPLGEGLVVGETVRCPWHHARFCLKTGEAVGAPAFDPVGAWSVEERDGRVFVGAALARPEPRRAEGARKRVVIVGGGAAGFAAAEMLRRKGFSGSVTVLSADSQAPYDRPSCSKEYLEGKAPREETALREAGFYEASDIDLRLGVTVAGFDPAARVVAIRGGTRLDYDALILAMGAEPQRPAAPGLDGPGVFLLRTLADADALIAAMQGASRAVVIGSSFIGLEAAAALRQRGLEVTVVAPEETPLEKILGSDVGRWVQDVHEKEGVMFRLGAKVTGYVNGRLTLESGEPIAADLVVVGTGVKPRVELAAAAGLDVDDGVVVDDRLRTSAEGVYAAGDIARYPDPISGRSIRVEHWVHAERQGQHIARLILGEDAPFTDPPFFWTKHYKRSVSYVGHAENFDRPEIDGALSEDAAVVSYREDGRITAVATIDRNLEGLNAEADFEATDEP